MTSQVKQSPSKTDLSRPSRSPTVQGNLEHFFSKNATTETSKQSLRVSISDIQEQPVPGSIRRKRRATEQPANQSSPQKRRRTLSGYAPPSKYDHVVNKLKDSLASDLICLFIGLNPGIRTATTGHAYNHPSNLFWRLLHRSGCTLRLCRAEEDGNMPRLYQLGLTNIVSRPTKDGSELSKEEMDLGVAELEAKILTKRPEAVAIVGKSIWESIWRVKHGKNLTKGEFKYGWQDDCERMGKPRAPDPSWKGAKVFVATTTSGLAATMSLQEKEEIWRRLGGWVEKRRSERVESSVPKVELEEHEG
ncbi:MAG: hypothetical protein LQ342_000413 [Letrouitia transgressa]|nr:MAG: hypothetical protein LQ342_000413 [Letrouitia transgressa]